VQELSTAYEAYKRHFLMAAKEQWRIHHQQTQLNGYSSQAAGFSRAAGVQQGYGESRNCMSHSNSRVDYDVVLLLCWQHREHMRDLPRT
jgi:hypothetical protein